MIHPSYPVCVGIVGKRGLSSVAGLRSCPGVQVIAFCEADAAVLEREATAHEMDRRYSSFDDLLSDRDVDAVVIGTPMHLHAAQTIAALQAGKHVLCEVTAAVTMGECDAVLQAVRAAPTRVYMMAENYCYLRPNVAVREMCQRGVFGNVYFGEGEYIHEVRNYHRFPDGTPTWRATWQVGVRGCTYGTHSLAPVMQWFRAAHGENERIASVSCFGTGVHTDPTHLHDDSCLMICQTTSGRLVKVRVDMLSNRPHLSDFYALQGTTGAYEATRFPGTTGANARVWLGDNVPDEGRFWRPFNEIADDFLPTWYTATEVDAQKAGHGGGDYYTAREFARAIQTGTPPTMDVYDALEWTATGLLSQQSIVAGGVPVAVPDYRKVRTSV
ncbi:MAG: Gfo/Idh/MocA family oxidoreductase [Armatimonadetes bacterium]|nr:Gfo/Idh/MocA family oxidoreductase [Armatimonadota bacterium]